MAHINTSLSKTKTKRNDNSKTFKELRKERKRRYYDKYRDGRKRNQSRKHSIGRGRKFHDNNRRGYRGYSRRATRFKEREKRTRLNKNRDFANNISHKSNDVSNNSNESNQGKRFKFDYNPDVCYKCRKLGHFKKDCSQMSNRTKEILERKAKREKDKINNILEKEKG